MNLWGFILRGIMEKKSYVYRHRRLDTNEIFYIGIGSSKNFKRAYDIKARSKWWKKVIIKTSYSVEILKENLTWEQACELEILLISEYGRKDLGKGSLVNMTDGGDGMIGRIKSEEEIENLRKMKTGKGNHFYGKKHSEDSKKKISEARLKMKFRHTNESKNKISESSIGKVSNRYGKKLTVKTKNKISKSLTEKYKEGNYNPMKGKKHSEETCFKISLNNKKKKLVIDLETGIFYESLAEAARFSGIPSTTLSSYLLEKKKNKTNLIYC